MAPPRIQCLNSARGAVNLGARAFSTSKSAAADAPRRVAATNAFLSSLEDSKPASTSAYKPAFQSNPYVSKGETTQNFGDDMFSPRSATTNAMNMISSRQRERGRGEVNKSTLETVEKSRFAVQLTKQIARRWKEGDVYAPKDLNGIEMAKWKFQSKPTRDVFDILDLNPLDNYSNFAMMSEFMTPMGRIRHRNDTGLRGANQRKVAKAIRRSIGIGMMPSVYRHPEIVRVLTAKQLGKSTMKPGSSTAY